MIVRMQEVVRDEGTVVVFSGRDDDGRPVTFTVDHRMAQGLVERIAPVYAEVEDWQVLG